MTRKWQLCSKHYHRFLRHGDTATIGKKGRPFPERMNTPETFWARVDKGLDRDCWPWTGRIVRGGYGSVKWQRKAVMSHRLAYFLTNEHWPAVVMHLCDNPPCCNPAHLRSGTARENTHDCITKGRFPEGSRSGNAKISEEIVMDLRAREPFWGCQTAWAKEFGIDQTTVSSILAGRSWKHVTTA